MILVAFAPLAIKMVRNVPLFVVVVLPLFVWTVSLFRFPEKYRKVLSVMAAVIVILITLRVFTDGWYISDRRQERTGLGWNNLNLPVEAVEYIRRKELNSPMINDLAFGGYLMWALDQKVFIDGRLEVAGEKFFVYAEESLLNQDRLDMTAKRFGADWVIFNYPLRLNLLKRMSQDKRWRLAYFDHLSAVFVRNEKKMFKYIDNLSFAVPEGEESFKLPGIDGERESAVRQWVSGFYRKQSYPSESCFKGLFHYMRGENSLSEWYFKKAVIESRGYYHEIYRNLAVVLFDQRKYAEALSCAEIALKANPGDKGLERMINKISSM